MRRDIFSLLSAITIAGTFAMAQAPAEPATPAQPATPTQQPATPATPATPSAQSSASTASETTLTGCLVQGSGPNVFILENAKAGSASASDKGKSYVLAVAPGSASVDFRTQLNRQVRIVGAADDKMASASASSSSSDRAAGSASDRTAGAAGGSVSAASGSASASATIKMDEKDMPKLSAKSVARVGDTCATAG